MIIIQLIYNLAILAAASVVSGFIDARWNRKSKTGKIFQGITFGFIAIIAMLNPYVLSPGIIFDGRSIILSLCALFFGTTAGVISAVMAIVVRLIIGGDGILMGVSVITSSLIIGLVFNQLRRRKHIVINAKFIYLLGILVHLAMIALMFFLPKNFVWVTFHTISLTVISIYPIVTVIIGKILLDQENNLVMLDEIKESEEKHRLLIENSHDIIYTITIDGTFTFVSSAWKATLGQEINDVIGKSYKSFVHPDDVLILRTWMRKVISTGQRGQGIEYRVKHITGTWHWHTSSAVPLRDETSVVVGLEGIARDITERKQAEEKLRQSEERLSFYIDHSPMAVIEWDSQLRISRWTGDSEKMFGFSAEEMLGKKNHEIKLIHEADIPVVDEVVKRLTSGQYNQIVSGNRNYKKDGSIIYCQWYNTIMIDDQGKILSAMSQVLDITEQKKAKESLEENQKQLTDLITFLPDATFAVDKEKKVILWNKAMEELTGISAEDILGKGDYEYTLPFYGVKRPQLMDLIFSNDEELFAKYPKISRKGDSITAQVFCNALYNNKGAWLFLKVSPLYDTEGNIIGAIESLRDITLQKQHEEEKRIRWEQLARQQEILIEMATSPFTAEGELENLSHMLTERVAKYMGLERVSIWLFDETETILECIDLFEYAKNEHSFGIKITENEFGNEFAALKNSKYVDANDTFTDSRTIGYLDTYINPNKIFSMLDGVIRFSERTLGVLCFECVGVQRQWTTEEITFVCQLADQIALILANRERKKVEKNLIKLSRAVEQSQVSIVITNKLGDIEYVNPKFLEVTGFSLEEVLGNNPRILKSGEFTSYDYKEMWNVLESGKEWNGIFHNKKKNGELFWESATISPVKDEFGEITYYVAVKEDITAKKMMEENLHQALEKAEEMNKLKTNFLANMNHEFRTPLNGILGFASFLCEELKDDDHVEMASNIFESGKRLSETLNLILDLSDVDANKIDISKDKLEVVSLVKNIAGTFTEVAQQKNISFNVVSTVETIYALLDIQLFPRVVNNLIDNAFKYTNSGNVNVEIGTVLSNKSKQFYVKVKDTGIGIPKDKIDLIWDPFRQVSEGLSRGYEGTGLGLTISKKITEMMGGEIEVKSESGKGSTFIIKFPVFIKDEKHTPNIFDINLKEETLIEDGKQAFTLPRLLYVEDDKINQRVVKLIVKNKYLIETADDGASALSMIKEKNYDTILMDINLGPGMDGIQVTKEIKKHQKYVKTPIIAVTAYTMESDKKKFIEAGCTHYLAKPFMRDELLNLLENVGNEYYN